MKTGRPTAWPTSCARCDVAKRVKSGMLRESVDQKPTFAVTDGRNTFQKSPEEANLEGVLSIGPKPLAPVTAHARSAADSAMRIGALYFSTTRILSMPLTRMA